MRPLPGPKVGRGVRPKAVSQGPKLSASYLLLAKKEQAVRGRLLQEL